MAAAALCHCPKYLHPHQHPTKSKWSDPQQISITTSHCWERCVLSPTSPLSAIAYCKTQMDPTPPSSTRQTNAVKYLHSAHKYRNTVLQEAIPESLCWGQAKFALRTKANLYAGAGWHRVRSLQSTPRPPHQNLTINCPSCWVPPWYKCTIFGSALTQITRPPADAWHKDNDIEQSDLPPAKV